MIARLNRLNGWRRLWLAGTILALIGFAVIYPVLEQSNIRDFSYRWAIERDYKNPTCSSFLKQPFDQLQEPQYASEGGTCWHIYTDRKYNTGNEAFGSYEDWALDNEKRYWISTAEFSGFMGIVVMIASAIIYAIGKTVAWIVRGFSQQQV